MADLPESNDWVPGIYQLETSDPVLGGPEGIDNLQAKQLASRSRWLRDQFQKLVDGVNSVGRASQLATARLLKFKGAATGSASFDGSADAEVNLTLADSGVVPGSYTKVMINAKGLVTAGANPTTLAEHGIVDALSTSGGTLKGNLFMEPGWSVAITPAQSESWAAGMHVADPDGTVYASLGFWGNNKTMRSAYLGLGPTAWATGNAVRVTPEGVFVSGSLVADLDVRSKVPFPSLTGVPDTLSGHGIVLATKIEAEQGIDNAKPMSALRVFQAIAKVVGQATEAAFGWAKVASHDQVNAGVDDTAMVTPLKLRLGFQLLTGANGFIIFPRWLGGLILQWGVTATYLVNTVGTLTTRFTYPIQFPNAAYSVFVTHEGTSSALSSAALVNGFDESGFLVSFENTRTDQSVAGRWFAIGR